MSIWPSNSDTHKNLKIVNIAPDADWCSSCGDLLTEIPRGPICLTKNLNRVLNLYVQTGHISKLPNFQQSYFIGPVVITGLETTLLVMALTRLHTQ